MPIGTALRATFLIGLIGCGAERARTSRSSADETPRSARTADTGMVDEEEFARMHELRPDAAPAPKGVDVDVAGSRAYLSRPDGASPVPGVVVIHEWWGLNDHIEHWSDRLADEGYAALAVDLYGGQVAEDAEHAGALMKTVDETRAKEILAAAHRFLREDERVRAPRRGVIGWCFGGAWALRHAIETPDLDAAIIYYGRLVTDEASLRRIEAKLFGVFANRDRSIPPQVVDEFVAALQRSDKTIELHRYDADHAFANPSGPRYERAPAADAWEKAKDFLQRTLRAR